MTSEPNPYQPPPSPMDAVRPRRVPMWVAIVGMAVNILFLPGLGTLITAQYLHGAIQLLMFLLGVPLCLSVIGLMVGGPMVTGAWIWGMVSGVVAIRGVDRGNAIERESALERRVAALEQELSRKQSGL